MQGKTLQNYYYCNLIKSFSLVYLIICLKLSIDLFVPNFFVFYMLIWFSNSKESQM